MTNNKVPKRRFKGFTGDWEQRKVGEVFEIITDFVAAGSFADLAKNVIYNSHIDYAQLVRTVDLKANFSNSSFVYVNKTAFEYLYRVNLDKPSIIMPNIGNCGEIYYVEPKHLPHKNNVLGPNAILVRSTTHDNLFSSFLLKTTNFQEQLKLIVSPNGQTKFNKTELKGISLYIPDSSEQTKIGSFFNELDSLITLHQRKLNKLEDLKISYLEKMFPQNKEVEPKFRFKGFTGDWEQRKVKDLFKVTRGYVLSTNKVSSSKTLDNPYPVYSSQTRDEGLMGFYDKYLYEDAITWTTDGANAGTVKYRSGKFYCTNVCGVLLKEKSSPNPMISEALNLVAKDYVSYVGNPKLMNNVFSEIKINIPLDENEQTKIGSFFNELDSLIALHQCKLDKLKNLKQAYLNEMFVN